MQKPPLGVGIIGAGVIFQEHIGGYRRLSNRVRVVGVAELDPQKLDAATKGNFIPVATGDYRELLQRDDIDIIDVCTPPAYHEEVVSEALAAGKYVVCEKPLATNLAAADRIARVADQYPGKLSVVYQLRYAPEMKRILWLRDNGHLGPLIYGAAIRFSPLSATASLGTGWWGNWQTAGGGVVMTQFIHHLDQLCHLFGKPLRVQAEMDTLKEAIESEDCFSATIRFEHGVLVNVTATAAAQHFDYRLDVVGKRMSAHLPWQLKCTDVHFLAAATAGINAAYPIRPQKQNNSLPARVLRKLGRMARILPPNRKEGPGALHAEYFRAVVDAIEADRPLPIDPQDARASLELCTAIYQSAITGETVELPLMSDARFYEGIQPTDYRPQKKMAAATPTAGSATSSIERGQTWRPFPANDLRLSNSCGPASSSLPSMAGRQP